MFARLVPLLLTFAAILTLPSTVSAQPPIDPGSKVWDVELNGVMQPGEKFLFTPEFDGACFGTWINFDEKKTWGWGTYFWDPVWGTIEYQNLSNDGGGGQSGVYSWTGTSYIRTWASHPQAPPMTLH